MPLGETLNGGRHTENTELRADISDRPTCLPLGSAQLDVRPREFEQGLQWHELGRKVAIAIVAAPTRCIRISVIATPNARCD